DVVLEPADAVAKIMEITAGKGADVAIEALGRQETFENCCAVTRHGGTVSSVGVYGQVPVLNLPTTGTFIHRTLVTTFCPVGTERLTRLMALIAGKKVDLTPLITHHLPLSETPAAYDMFRSHADGVMKIALKP
ncbi:MAG: zinc-binding dehydrogenase, partial [Dehalococcoidia bacterium]